MVKTRITEGYFPKFSLKYTSHTLRKCVLGLMCLLNPNDGSTDSTLPTGLNVKTLMILDRCKDWSEFPMGIHDQRGLSHFEPQMFQVAI